MQITLILFAVNQVKQFLILAERVQFILTYSSCEIPSIKTMLRPPTDEKANPCIWPLKQDKKIQMEQKNSRIECCHWMHFRFKQKVGYTRDFMILSLYVNVILTYVMHTVQKSINPNMSGVNSTHWEDIHNLSAWSVSNTLVTKANFFSSLSLFFP